ncbi:hypothetical protein N7461_001370 [Penicillium sp. DV-2018c]|nr:hypothetical protein N7461_001370 [Penicillium sp. DV-2018c]
MDGERRKSHIRSGAGTGMTNTSVPDNKVPIKLLQTELDEDHGGDVLTHLESTMRECLNGDGRQTDNCSCRSMFVTGMQERMEASER